MTKIPFNIKYRTQIESGEYTVVTREDCPVEIKIWDLKGNFPIVGVYYDEINDRDLAVQVSAEGRCSITPGEEYCDDFFIITDKPELTEFEYAVQEIFYKGREDNIDLLKITSSTLLNVARKQLTAELPRWKKTNLPDGIDYSLDEAIFSFKGYSISINELEKLPKEDCV
jgi:hypothetical protein